MEITPYPPSFKGSHLGTWLAVHCHAAWNRNPLRLSAHERRGNWDRLILLKVYCANRFPVGVKVAAVKVRGSLGFSESSVLGSPGAFPAGHLGSSEMQGAPGLIAREPGCAHFPDWLTLGEPVVPHLWTRLRNCRWPGLLVWETLY